MKVFLFADLECVAGVVHFMEYCRPEGRFYELAKELATLEVNAAVEGLLEAGATEIVVLDGHGPGGLLPHRVHPEAKIVCGKPLPFPGFLDGSFDAALMIGQHAKANADGGHLCHSGSFDRDDWLLNGVSVGEIALNILHAQYFNVPTVMLSGDLAAGNEAQMLVPEIETAAVIEGWKRGPATGLTEEENKRYNVVAAHLSPVKAQRLVRDAARRCLDKRHAVSRYWVAPPYEMTRVRRRTETAPPMIAVTRSDDLMELFRLQPVYAPRP